MPAPQHTPPFFFAWTLLPVPFLPYWNECKSGFLFQSIYWLATGSATATRSATAATAALTATEADTALGKATGSYKKTL